MKIVPLILFVLTLGACASTCPKPTVTEIPIAVAPKHIDIPECPVLPVLSIPPDATLDTHLKSWEASIVILRGCYQSREQILREINK